MPIQHRVLVIGAGPAGLATSACLRREGIVHTVLEREQEITPMWRRHYDRLHLHTVKQHSAMPFAPWPASAPTYPTRDEVVQYFERYAKEHGVEPHFGVEVRRVERRGNGLLVRTSNGELGADAVVMATGYLSEPVLPEVPGLADFAGSQVHSTKYKNPEPYRGKRTLVMGCGNSGAEIALDLAERGVDVSMVVRSPTHVTPRDLWGQPAQVSAIRLARLPLRLGDAISTTLLKFAVGDLSRWGIRRPELGPNTMIQKYGRVPMLDVGTVAMIKKDRIKVRPGVTSFTRDRATFTDGSSEPFEAVIFATGLRSRLPILVEGYERISDAIGRPHRHAEESEIPGLFFVGFRNPSTGGLREISLEAPRAAAAVRRRLGLG